MSKIYVFHGVNLHLLGVREPDIYGKTSLEELDKKLTTMGEENGALVECRQTNHEGEMIDWVTSLKPTDFLILNPAAWTHSSYALFDALKGVQVPTLEVHLSNIHARESFRSNSLITGACLGQISGLGTDSYLLAMAYAIEFQKHAQNEGVKTTEATNDSL